MTRTSIELEYVLPPKFWEELHLAMMCQSRWLEFFRGLLWRAGWYKDWDVLPTETITIEWETQEE